MGLQHHEPNRVKAHCQDGRGGHVRKHFSLRGLHIVVNLNCCQACMQAGKPSVLCIACGHEPRHCRTSEACSLLGAAWCALAPPPLGPSWLPLSCTATGSRMESAYLLLGRCTRLLPNPPSSPSSSAAAGCAAVGMTAPKAAASAARRSALLVRLLPRPLPLRPRPRPRAEYAAYACCAAASSSELFSDPEASSAHSRSSRGPSGSSWKRLGWKNDAPASIKSTEAGSCSRRSERPRPSPGSGISRPWVSASTTACASSVNSVLTR